MLLTTEEINEALGLGAKEQDDLATPAAESENAGTAETSAEDTTSDNAENDTDADETTDTGTDNAGTAETSNNAIAESSTATQADEPQMTPEERKANAARRREQEQLAAIDKAVDAAVAKRISEAISAERTKSEAEWSNFFAKANIENPLTGRQITTKAEFDDWAQRDTETQMQRDFSEGNLTPELLQKTVSELPEIKRIRELEQQRQQEQLKAESDRQLAEISKLDPAMKTLEDIVNSPTGPAFAVLVQEKGYDFLGAFKVANFERLSSAQATQQAAAVKQQTLQNIKGKEHLNQMGKPQGAGGNTLPVPADVKQLYRELNPNMTDADIAKDYTKRKAATA